MRSVEASDVRIRGAPTDIAVLLKVILLLETEALPIESALAKHQIANGLRQHGAEQIGILIKLKNGLLEF